MTFDLVFLLGSMLFIMVGCELFANGVENVGRKLNLSHAAAGSLLAAVGTAMPETLVPIIALIFGGEHSEEIGIGAILGAPFMLTTLAFFMLFITALLQFITGRRENFTLNVSIWATDFELKVFVLTMTLVLITSSLGSRPVKVATAIVLLFFYAAYFRAVLRHEPESSEKYSEMLYFNKFFRAPGTPFYILLQLFTGLAFIFIGAREFVHQISIISLKIGVPALILSLLITPVATELPEKYNSITWLLRKKDTLALANITGAMIFQSMIPVAIGMLFTSWELGRVETRNIAFAIISALIVWVSVLKNRRLDGRWFIPGGVLYVLYIYLIVTGMP